MEYGDGVSYRAASPSIAPSAIAEVVKWPAWGYLSSKPCRGEDDEKDCPISPCGSDRAAASPQFTLPTFLRRCNLRPHGETGGRVHSSTVCTYVGR